MIRIVEDTEIDILQSNGVVTNIQKYYRDNFSLCEHISECRTVRENLLFMCQHSGVKNAVYQGVYHDHAAVS